MLASSVAAAASPAPSNGDAAYAALAQNYYTESFAANAAVASAISAYAAWIKTLKPSGSFAVGADRYLAVGEKAVAQTRYSPPLGAT